MDTFQAESVELGTIIAKTKIHENRPNIGSLRENKLMEFLNRYIPSRCNVTKGGFIFDLVGNRSKQIDLLILNDATLKFKTHIDQTSETFNCVEGCLAGISVKTFLDTNQLIDSIENLSSIPTEKSFTKNPFVSNWDNILRYFPQRIIFAYDGNNIETIHEEFGKYVELKKIPDERTPNLIIVNDKFFIAKSPAGGTVSFTTGEMIEGGVYMYQSKDETSKVGGLALMNMLTRIQRVANVMNQLEINYDQYYKKLFDSTRTTSE